MPTYLSTNLIVHLSLADEGLLDCVGPVERDVLLETIASELAFANAERELSRARLRNGTNKVDRIA